MITLDMVFAVLASSTTFVLGALLYRRWINSKEGLRYWKRTPEAISEQDGAMVFVMLIAASLASGFAVSYLVQWIQT